MNYPSNVSDEEWEIIKPYVTPIMDKEKKRRNRKKEKSKRKKIGKRLNLKYK